MPTLTSALPPVFAALAAAVNADNALQVLLAGDRVYALTAPTGALPAYLVLGSASASPFSAFGQAGEASAVTLHVWTSGAESAAALAIYAELYRVLHLKPLAVAGHTLCYGSLTLTTITPDPGGEMVHLVAMYRPTTLPT